MFWDRLHLTPGALGGGPWLNNSFLMFPWMFWWGGQPWALPPRASNLSLSEACGAGRCLALWSERATSCGDMENCWVLLWDRGFFLCLIVSGGKKKTTNYLVLFNVFMPLILDQWMWPIFLLGQFLFYRFSRTSPKLQCLKYGQTEEYLFRNKHKMLDSK